MDRRTRPSRSRRCLRRMPLPSTRHRRVSPPSRRSRIQGLAAHGPVEAGVAEAEDASVGCHFPVPVAVGCRRHAHDRGVQGLAAHGPRSWRRQAEDATVGRHFPVPLAVGRRRHAHDRRVKGLATHGSVEAGIAETEDASVGRHFPVPVAVGCRRHAHDRGVQGLAAHGSKKLASPKPKMPPSDATSQYPWPSGVAAMPMAGRQASSLPPRRSERGHRRRRAKPRLRGRPSA